MWRWWSGACAGIAAETGSLEVWALGTAGAIIIYLMDASHSQEDLICYGG